MADGQHIVFFLGAGFSAEADQPMMAQFGDASRRELATEKERWDDGYEQARELFTDAGVVYERFAEQCRRIHGPSDFDPDNMEDVYSLVEVLESSDVTSVDVGGTPVTTSELARRIRLWLWKVYHRLPPAVNSQIVPPRPYVDFVEMVKEAGIAAHTTFLTTNYDLVLEYYAKHAGIPCKYPLSRDQDFVAYTPPLAYVQV